MYVFKLFDIDSHEHNTVTFFKKPSKMDIVDLLWFVDYQDQSTALNELMKATGEDVFFSTVDEGDVSEEDEIFMEGIYASLAQV